MPKRGSTSKERQARRAETTGVADAPPPGSTQKLEIASATAFEAAASEILTGVQALLRRVIHALPGRIKRPTDLQRATSADAKLAWQIYNFSVAKSVIPASVHLPGSVSMKRFLSLAAKGGVSTTLTAKTARRFEQFEKFVADHAGSRQTFNSMVSRGDGDGDDVALVHKKAAARSAAHFLGVQMDASIITMIVCPGSDGGHDLATIVYKLGIRRLRADARIRLGRVIYEPTPKDGTAGPTSDSHPSAQSQTFSHSNPAQMFAAIFTEFCTDPKASIITDQHAKDFVEIALAPLGVGTSSSTDWAFGTVFRRWNPKPAEIGSVHFALDVTTPVNCMVLDVLVPASIPNEPATSVRSYVGFLDSRPISEVRNEFDHLFISETIDPLGTGPDALQLEEAPRYQELIEHACARLKWDPTQMRAYRSRILYPLVGSSIDFFFDFGTSASASLDAPPAQS